MFYGLLVGIHLLVALLLIIIILMQAAKGGGLSGAFGTGAGSSPLFGAATSSVMVKTTTVLAAVFAITCLSIAGIQARRAAVMKGVKPLGQKQEVVPTEKKEAPSEEEGTMKGEEEKALSPVEGETKETGAGMGAEKEKALSPVEGETEKKEAPEGESKESPPAKEEASPVEKEVPEKENLSPVEGESGSEK